jgi:hypothetical protein
MSSGFRKNREVLEALAYNLRCRPGPREDNIDVFGLATCWTMDSEMDAIKNANVLIDEMGRELESWRVEMLFVLVVQRQETPSLSLKCFLRPIGDARKVGL